MRGGLTRLGLWLQVVDTFHRYCRPTRIDPKLVNSYIDQKYGSFGQAEVLDLLTLLMDGRAHSPKLLRPHQEWHKSAIPLEDALAQLRQWLVSHGVLHKQKESQTDEEDPQFVFVTCGDWDLKNALPRNCAMLGRAVPSFMQRWINIKLLYQDFYQKRRAPAGRFLPLKIACSVHLLNPILLLLLLSFLGMTQMLKELEIELEGVHHWGKDDANNITKILQVMLRHGCCLKITNKGHKGGQSLRDEAPETCEEE